MTSLTKKSVLLMKQDLVRMLVHVKVPKTPALVQLERLSTLLPLPDFASIAGSTSEPWLTH